MAVKRSRRGPVSFLLAVLAAAGLGYDAYVHLHLAHIYDHNGTQLTQGELFRTEAVIAVVVALGVVLWDNRVVWFLAGITGLGGAALVVLYRYVDVGSLGPLPNMHEAVWYGDKTRSAFAEAGVGVVWVLREALRYLGMRFSARSAGGSAARPARDAGRH